MSHPESSDFAVALRDSLPVLFWLYSIGDGFWGFVPKSRIPLAIGAFSWNRDLRWVGAIYGGRPASGWRLLHGSVDRHIAIELATYFLWAIGAGSFSKAWSIALVFDFRFNR